MNNMSNLQQQLALKDFEIMRLREALAKSDKWLTSGEVPYMLQINNMKLLSTPTTYDDLMAWHDAQLGEPVAWLGKWNIDKSTGTDILTLDGCSVIEGKYANYIMGLLKNEIDKVVNELETTLR
jgi:hypothetical protein